MKIRRVLLLVVVLAPALVVVGATRALACSCIPPQPDEVALEDANAVFTGTVAAIEPGVDIGFDPVTWTFAVHEVYKGDVGVTQDITSQTQSAACGVVFKEEERYVVFAYRDAGKLQTNSCTNTRPLAEKDVELRGATTPAPPESPATAADPEPASGWNPIAIGAVAMVVTVGAVTMVLMARRRRS